MADFQPVVFSLDEERYGMDISYVNGIESEQQIVRVPNASRNIKGIINLRGEVIPVMNLRAKFNTPNQEPPEETELIIINLPGNKVALEVDGVEQIHHISEENMVDMPMIAQGEGVKYFDKVAKVDDKLIILINPLELLSDDERKAVEKLTEEKTDN